MSLIKFGTDGWRAKMGGDFSFHNVRLFAHGYAEYLRKIWGNRRLNIIVNYDTRLLSEKFAKETARVLSKHNIVSHLCVRDTPLAAVSLGITHYKFQGAVNFTASFNEPIYNGIKLLNSKGCPALPSETVRIENEIDIKEKDYKYIPCYPDESNIRKIDLREFYIKYIEERIDFAKIKSSGLKIIVDNLYGTSRDYMDTILNDNGIEIESIHNLPYSAYGDIIPYCNKSNLTELRDFVKKEKADIGLSTDIDGDRFGIVDEKGGFLCSNAIMPLLLEYLITVRKMEGGIVKSVSTTDSLRKVADYYMRKVYTTPVGFKYLADMMSTRKAFLAVESSNGAALNGPVMMKDGILFNLLVTEMMAWYGMSLTQLLKSFGERFPKFYSFEVELPRSVRRIENLEALMGNPLKEIAGEKINRIKMVDGVKYMLDKGWLLIRQSGTSPIVRIYSEAVTAKMAREFMKFGRQLIG